MSAKTFYGKYRGLVTENIDPMQIGRVMVDVPDVLGNKPSSWAMPCVPVAGLQSGCFLVPPIGSSVWIEFEQGNPDYPIWTGGFWGTVAEVPTAATPQSYVFQTAGASVVLNQTGIYINNGQGASITLSGPTVTIQGLKT